MSSRTVIWFIVSVPVLSTQMTVAEPSVSSTGVRRVSTCFWDSRHAPSARKIVSTTGNSSGSIAMAVPMPASRPSSQWPRVRPYTTTTSAAAPNPSSAIVRTRRSISRWRGVRSGSIVRRAVPIRPSSVPSPVSLTIAMPWPLTTSVPENTHGVASPPGRPIASERAWGSDSVLRTGTDSPVSVDSSTEKFTHCTSTPSAGTRSPSASRT